MLLVIAIVVVSLVWILFFSRSITLGKILYETSNKIDAKIAKLVKAESKVDNTRYVYLSNERKDRPYLLLLHGFSADKTIWLKFAKHATNDFNLLIPDLLGHGDIEYNPAQSYSTLAQTDYIVDFLKYILSQDLDARFIIAGNSMGGMITAQLNKQWFEKGLSDQQLLASMLIDPAGAKSDFAENMYAGKHNPFVHMQAETVFEFYRLAMNKPPFMPKCVFYYIAHSNYLIKQKQYEHMFSDFFNIDEFFTGPISFIGQAPLLVWGRKDGLLPVSDATQWSAMSGVDAIIIEDIGHMPMLECPSYCYHLLQQSLNK